MRDSDHEPSHRRARRTLGGLIAAALLAIAAFGAGSALAQTPVPEEFQPNEVRGNPWICIDRGYQYGFTVARNIPSGDDNSVTTPVVNNGKNVLGKDTPPNAGHFITLTSTDGVNFSWETNFDVGAVIVKGSDAFNQYTYAEPGQGGVQGDTGPLTTPLKNGTNPNINQVTLCWGPVIKPPKLASLTITKLVDGTQPNEITPPFAFRITEGATTFDFDLVGDQTSEVYGIAVGVPTTVEELLGQMPPGYAFRTLSCQATDPDLTTSGTPVASTVIDINGPSAVITPVNRAQVHCTFTNEKLPTIQVTKLVAGEGAPAATFALQVNDNAPVALASGESSTVYSVPVGANTVSEDLTGLPANFALTGISCTGVEASVDLPAGTASMNLTAGQNTVCTFTNTYTAPPPPQASLTVTKAVDGSTPGETTPPFAFDLSDGETSQGFSLVGDQTSEAFDIAVGAPTTVQELLDQMPAGYAFGSLACQDNAPGEGQQTTDITIDGASAVITPVDGAQVACTFTNVQLPTIQVAKLVAGEGAPAATFALQVNDNAPVALASGESSTVYSVPVGANTVSEDLTGLPANFALTGISCTGVEASVDLPAGTASMNLTAGQNTVCTFTNTYTAPPPPPPPPPAEIAGTPQTPPAVVNQVRTPRLAIVKTGPLRARPLQRLTYTIRVRNPGRAVARNVVITDRLPSGLTFVKSTRRATVRGRTIIIPMGNLRPGQARVVRLTVRAAANVRGRKVNLAVARATNVRPVRDTAPTVFRPIVRRVVPAVTG